MPSEADKKKFLKRIIKRSSLDVTKNLTEAKRKRDMTKFIKELLDKIMQ